MSYLKEKGEMVARKLAGSALVLLLVGVGLSAFGALQAVWLILFLGILLGGAAASLYQAQVLRAAQEPEDSPADHQQRAPSTEDRLFEEDLPTSTGALG